MTKTDDKREKHNAANANRRKKDNHQGDTVMHSFDFELQNLRQNKGWINVNLTNNMISKNFMKLTDENKA